MGKVRVIEQGYSVEERTRAIDNETKEAIKCSYELEDEIKLLRRAIAKIAQKLQLDLGTEFNNYNSLVETIVASNKEKKTKVKSTSIKVKQKEVKS